MQLIVHLDCQGVSAVIIEATPEDMQAAHSFFARLRPAIERLGEEAQQAAYDMEVINGGHEVAD